MKRAILMMFAALLATPAAAGHKHPITDHQRIRALQELVYQLRMQAKAATDAPAFLKHAWPALTGEEKDAITEVAKTLPKGVKSTLSAMTPHAPSSPPISTTRSKALMSRAISIGR